MKFEISSGRFFKEWRMGNVRILKDVAAGKFARYSVQAYDGRCWNEVSRYRTLAEAKAAVELLEAEHVWQ